MPATKSSCPKKQREEQPGALKARFEHHRSRHPGLVWAKVQITPGSFELFFLTELRDHSWIATGLVDDLERAVRTIGNPGVEIQVIDEAFPQFATAHKASLAKKPLAPAPGNPGETKAAFLKSRSAERAAKSRAPVHRSVSHAAFGLTTSGGRA